TPRRRSRPTRRRDPSATSPRRTSGGCGPGSATGPRACGGASTTNAATWRPPSRTTSTTRWAAAASERPAPSAHVGDGLAGQWLEAIEQLAPRRDELVPAALLHPP